MSVEIQECDLYNLFCFISYMYVLCRCITIALKNRITHVNDQGKAAYIKVRMSSTVSLFIMLRNPILVHLLCILSFSTRRCIFYSQNLCILHVQA